MMTLDEERAELNAYEKRQQQIFHEWQLCPKCVGTGLMTVMYPGYVIDQTALCDLCNGKKIISKLNGLPPNV
jgi:hypothetical protein